MRFIVLIAIVVGLSGCIGTKRYNRYLSEGYKKSADSLQSTNPDIIFRQNPSIIDTVSVATNKKSQFVPAIIFWQWEKSVSATLAEKHQANKIQSYMARYADSLQLGDKLNGNKLQISIESAPANFTYTNKGYFMYLFIAYVTAQQETIKPEFSDIKLSYTLVDNNNAVVKKGEITVLDTNVPARNVWKSTKKFTWKYLDEYERNVRLMSKQAIDKLSKEI